MSISLVITTYKRNILLSNTLASILSKNVLPDEIIVVDDENSSQVRNICKCFDVKYIPRTDRPNVVFSNPSIPINIGLKVATSDIVILQNAECKHDSNVVEQFKSVQKNTAVFAKVVSAKKDGSFDRYYTAPNDSERPYFFCGAMHREHFMDLGGMDENFVGPGFDDDDFAIRMKKAGIRFIFADDILVTHQWHDRPELNSTPSYELFRNKHGMAIW